MTENSKFKPGQIAYMRWTCVPESWRKAFTGDLLVVRVMDNSNKGLVMVGPPVQEPALPHFTASKDLVYSSVKQYCDKISDWVRDWSRKYDLTPRPAPSDKVVVVYEQIRRVLPLPPDGAHLNPDDEELYAYVCATSADELGYEVLERQLSVKYARDARVECGPEVDRPDVDKIQLLVQTLEHALRNEKAALLDELHTRRDRHVIRRMTRNLDRYADALEEVGVLVERGWDHPPDRGT